MEGEDFSSPPPTDRAGPYACQNQFQTQRTKKNKNTKRFSDDQIRSLESMFKLETKLEPRKKLQLARELALQPRQVAIWFQNRRARWKSKQLEQEYRVLKANYDNLNSQYESLKKEKHSLHIQLQKLSDLLKETHPASNVSEDLEGRSTPRAFDDEDMNSELKAKTSTITDQVENSFIMHSDDDERGNMGYLPQYEEPELLSLCEQLDGPSEATERWCNFDSSGISSHSCGNSSWWEF